MQSSTTLERLLRRDRLIVLGALGVIAVLAWLYTIHLAWMMATMEGQAMLAMPRQSAWTLPDFLLNAVMWIVMMVAMMLPAATPMMMMYAAMQRRHQEQHLPFVPTGVFVLGYFLVWSGFSVLATIVQWGLHSAALLSSMMGHTGPVLGGALLILAGVFQWTPLKSVCLTHCRSPLGFFMTNWQDGYSGALRMGWQHGLYCLGCCWILMALLFAAGVMNLLWVALLTVFVLVEKIVPYGDLLGRITGVGLIVGGLVMVGQVWS